MELAVDKEIHIFPVSFGNFRHVQHRCCDDCELAEDLQP
jgi:hypothetical protein